jgi:hypothetical protein
VDFFSLLLLTLLCLLRGVSASHSMADVQEYLGDDEKAQCAFCSIQNSWFTLWLFLLGDFDYV